MKLPIPKHPPPPLPHESRGPTSDMEADGYATPLVHVAPSASGEDASHKGKYNAPFALSKQGLVKYQAQQATASMVGVPAV
jgi:hypothetical protein